ncbi:MAG TPA: hypothetical protein VMF61_03760 [Candidatus Acidoferrales bacterium]|nr:hypothetical protein [Candidatus Acidoferrales bacterium]
MSDLKTNLDNTRKNVRDTVDEAMHRSAAEGERARRDIEGDAMTPGEKVTSVADEAKHRTEAGMDHAKRKLRGDDTA